MTEVSARSFTRVTLALDIIGKVASGPCAGFHELAAIKHTISLHDVITVRQSPRMSIVCNNPAVPADETNICWKTAMLLKSEFGISQNVAVVIEKRIPVMGGLAGGSANAATMFLLLRELWGLDLDKNRLIGLSRKIGMDVPFYFSGTTALDTEAGGAIEQIPTTLRFDMILATPGFGVSTSQAYGNIDYATIGRDRHKTLAMKQCLATGDRAGAIAAMHNDFELSVFVRYPELSRVKRRLLDAGCEGAVLSGSGSTVIGILGSPEAYERIRLDIGTPSLLVSSYTGSQPAC